MNTLRSLPLFVCLLAAGAALPCAGCGGEPPVVEPVAPSGPPGAITSTITDANAFPIRKLEVRLLQTPPAGTVTDGGDLSIVHAPSLRDVKEGPELKLIQRAETNDFGKFKLDNIPPGEYLLSVGTLTTGVWRQWVKIEPGQTLTPAIKLPGRKP